jgi:hypothetical protein
MGGSRAGKSVRKARETGKDGGMIRGLSVILGFQGDFLFGRQGQRILGLFVNFIFQDDQAFRADSMADRFFTVSRYTASLYGLADHALALGAYSNHIDNLFFFSF